MGVGIWPSGRISRSRFDSYKQDPDPLPSIVNALSNLQPLWATNRIIDGVFYQGNLNKNKYG